MEGGGGEVKQSRPTVQSNFTDMRGFDVLLLDNVCVLCSVLFYLAPPTP